MQDPCRNLSNGMTKIKETEMTIAALFLTMSRKDDGTLKFTSVITNLVRNVALYMSACTMKL